MTFQPFKIVDQPVVLLQRHITEQGEPLGLDRMPDRRFSNVAGVGEAPGNGQRHCRQPHRSTWPHLRRRGSDGLPRPGRQQQQRPIRIFGIDEHLVRSEIINRHAGADNAIPQNSDLTFHRFVIGPLGQRYRLIGYRYHQHTMTWRLDVQPRTSHWQPAPPQRVAQFPRIPSRATIGRPVESEHAGHHRTTTGGQRHAGSIRRWHRCKPISEMFELTLAEKNQSPTGGLGRIGNQQPPVATRPVPVHPPPHPFATTTEHWTPTRGPFTPCHLVEGDSRRRLHVLLQKHPSF